jgi:hypothetical protein
MAFASGRLTSERSARSAKSRGQATVEYMIMLAFAVTFIFTIFKGVLLPRIKALEATLEKKLDSLYSGDNLHQLIFSVPKK